MTHPNPISENILDSIIWMIWVLLSTDWLLNHLVLRFALFEYRQYHLQVQADIEHFLGSSIVFEQFWQKKIILKHTKISLKSSTCRVSQPLEPFSELFSFIEGAVELVGREHGSDSVEDLAHLPTPGVETAATTRLSTGQDGRGRTQPDGVKAARTANVSRAALWISLNLVCNEASL